MHNTETNPISRFVIRGHQLRIFWARHAPGKPTISCTSINYTQQYNFIESNKVAFDSSITDLRKEQDKQSSDFKNRFAIGACLPCKAESRDKFAWCEVWLRVACSYFLKVEFIKKVALFGSCYYYKDMRG